MKNKTKISLILSLNAIILITGLSIAYCNTKTFGFDADARLASVNREGITVMDYELDYATVEEIIEKTEKIIPENSISI